MLHKLILDDARIRTRIELSSSHENAEPSKPKALPSSIIQAGRFGHKFMAERIGKVKFNYTDGLNNAMEKGGWRLAQSSDELRLTDNQ